MNFFLWIYPTLTFNCTDASFLRCLAKGGPTLIIGHHELKGSATKLKEPFAILRKRKSNKISPMNDKDGNTSSESKRLKSHSGVQLEVVGVVKTKLMFDQYPKSIMR